MPEHVHLLMSEPTRMTPSQALQILKQRVSRQIRSEKLSEQELQRFWGRRFYDFNVYTLAKMKEKLEYMHANPVNRKLVGSATEWPWSSCSHYSNGARGLVAIEALEEMRETGSARGTA
jgi:putative transposase